MKCKREILTVTNNLLLRYFLNTHLISLWLFLLLIILFAVDYVLDSKFVVNMRTRYWEYRSYIKARHSFEHQSQMIKSVNKQIYLLTYVLQAVFIQTRGMERSSAESALIILYLFKCVHRV